MKKTSLLVLAMLMLWCAPAFSQCTTSNATSCVCEIPGSTNCDLLPDLIVGRPPLLVSGSNGVIEYSQVGNGIENGRLRVSVTSPNIGHGPLEIRGTNTYICGTDTLTGTAPATCPNSGLPPRQLVVQRVFHKDGNTMSYYDRDAGSMTYHPTHGHMHVDEWGIYTLRSSNNDPDPLNWPIIGTGAKLAFCLMDYGSCSTYNGHCVDSLGNTLLNGDFPNYGLGGGSYNCSSSMQGISSGYTDIYYQYLDGMYLNIPPGTCNGNYFIVVQIDPYNYFLEENENNNVIVVPYSLTKQAGTVPVITASGSTAICPGETIMLTSSPSPSYLWSTGDTTQSINVSQVGTYSVTTDVNTICPATSQPLSITVQTIPVSITPTASAICSGESTTLNTSIAVPPTGIVQTSFTNNTVYNIPDNNSTGVSSPVTVSGINPATLSTISIFSVQADITHTYTADLVVSLVSPSGNTINLSNRRGGAGDNFSNTVFSMTAPTPISAGAAPFSGAYKPDEFFSLLTGDANGVWQLKVTDLAGVDTGTVNTWTLTLNNAVPAPLTYSWTSNPSGFISTDENPVVNPGVNTTYTVEVYNTISGCTGTTSSAITVNSLPQVTFSSLNDVCINSAGLLLTAGSPAGGNYSGSGVVANTFYPPLAGQGTHNILYEYTDNNGCSGSASQSIFVTGIPSSPTVMQGTTLVCGGSKQFYSVASDPDVLSYSWVVPSGVQILSGQGANQIQVAFAQNYSTNALCVYATNNCGAATPYCVTLERKHGRYCAIRVPTSWEQRDDNTNDGELLAQNENISDNAGLILQPNPATEKTEIIVSSAQEGTYRLIVMNAIGELVYSNDVEINSDYKVLQLDLASYSSGIYMISLSNGETIINSKLVVE